MLLKSKLLEMKYVSRIFVIYMMHAFTPCQTFFFLRRIDFKRFDMQHFLFQHCFLRIQTQVNYYSLIHFWFVSVASWNKFKLQCLVKNKEMWKPTVIQFRVIQNITSIDQGVKRFIKNLIKCKLIDRVFLLKKFEESKFKLFFLYTIPVVR